MSDTPRTDRYAVAIETARACLDIDAWVPYQFCRDLERELIGIHQGMLCYKEVLIGAEFENISAMPSKGIEFCHAIGRNAKDRIREIILQRNLLEEENKQLTQELARIGAGLR